VAKGVGLVVVAPAEKLASSMQLARGYLCEACSIASGASRSTSDATLLRSSVNTLYS